MELRLPLLGDVMTEATVTEWFQADGVNVRAGEPLYQMETDKVSLTVDAPQGGTLERVVRAGETVPVGTVVGRLVGAAAEPQTPDSQLQADVEVREVREVPEVRATPAARALARELGVDLRRIASGQRLREADVQAYVRADDVPGTLLEGRRKVIAERMRASLRQSAQLTVSMEVDMTDALQLREQLRQLVEEDCRPTINDLVLRATVLALREHPALNATLSQARLQVHAEVHVGMAVDADEGLVVPVIRGAQLLDLFSLARRTRDVADRARGNALHAADVRGGTFTVTSLGPLGVDFFTPILNPPQVAILGIGRIFPKLQLQRGTVQERQMLYLNVSFDHQALDGAPAARFLQSVKRFLELPAALVVAAGHLQAGRLDAGRLDAGRLVPGR